MSEIDAADYDRLKYYDGWSQAIRRADMDAYKKAQQGRGK